MGRGAILVLLLILAAVFAGALRAPAAAQAEQTIEDNATPTMSASTGSITIGIIGLAPYGYIDDTGFLRGFDVEYGQEIAQYANLDPDFKMYESTAAAYAALQSGEVDALMDFGKSEQNQQFCIFSDHTITVTDGEVFTRLDNTGSDYGDINSLKDMTIGATTSNLSITGFSEWCATQGIAPNIVLFDSSDQVLAALDAGQVDAAVAPASTLDGYHALMYFNPIGGYVVFAKSNTALKAKIDAAMALLFSEDPYVEERLSSKYIDATRSSALDFTSDEMDYIAQHPVLRVAVVKGDMPYYYVEDGVPKGITPDYYRVVAQKTGFTIEFVECPDQSAVKAAVQNGTADIVGIYGGDVLTANSEELLRTNAYVSQSGVQITRAGWSGEVKKAAVVQRRFTILSLQLEAAGSTVELVPYADNDACYAALESGAVDAIYSSLAAANWQINRHGSSRLAITTLPGVTLEMSGAVAEDNYSLCGIMNSVARVSESEIQSIITTNSTSADTLQSAIEKMPASSLIAIAVVLTSLIVILIVLLVMLMRRQRERARVLAEAANTERQKIQLEAMAKSTDEKNQFFSNISHDMRTPLNAIIGFSQLAKNEHASPSVDDYLEKINESGTLLLGLIDDTLTISKSGKGKLSLHPTPCLNSDIFNSIVVPIQKTAEDRSVILTADRSHLREHAIMADRLSVQKIALNLLSNAIKFTPSGKNVWFTMASDPENSDDPDTLIIVRDEGVGMSREFQQHLYEPFSQEQRTGYAGTGTGLGLAIVDELVKLMGGTVVCESEQGVGTTFTVRIHFPLTEMPEKATSEVLAPIDLAGHRVLLCEDNALNAEVAQRLLANKGLSVTYADNGKAGVGEFANSQPHTYDAILMDVRMPIMDGLTASRAIRALDRPDAQTVPIIAMTADAFEDDIKRCFDAGMNDHVAKPIDPERLYVALGAAIARREASAPEGE